VARPMSSQRGFTLIELLVALLGSAVVLLGLSSAYVAVAKTLAQSRSQAALQRQGTLALAEIGQRVRSAQDPNPLGIDAITDNATCRGHANSVQVVVPVTPGFPNGTVCYYAGDSGELWQANSTGGGECTDTTCWNLLSEKLQSRPPGWTGISLLVQSGSPGEEGEGGGGGGGGGNPRCPLDSTGNPLPAGARCFVMTKSPISKTQVTVAFTITDGISVMPFRVTLSCSGRNC
jgi:prepilin-type N-terminal cleavage/methylation domain-containing protein